jgi:hypothetical protein
MSAFGGKADVIQGVAECPLIAKSGHWATATYFGIRDRVGIEGPPDRVEVRANLNDAIGYDAYAAIEGED